ncbi:MAG: cell division protein ZapA [Limimaricola sp.]|uniref:cell division protein ZapA n=1 Tax=Limimaricola sp. TaxID=2211665 RepID=UPI001DA978B6|nr:cell division protein ZapA [Limimaricola sp.]MBI1418377.1 cell division protein ZapA [Limimaricola sp.]
MAEVEITIGGRSFEVACQDGEEPFLQSAAAMLDNEASALSGQIGRMPESRMLLMAGLMLADKTAGLEERLRTLEARLSEVEGRPEPTPTRVEVPVVPGHVTEALAEIAAQAEALADEVEARGSAGSQPAE